VIRAAGCGCWDMRMPGKRPVIDHREGPSNHASPHRSGCDDRLCNIKRTGRCHKKVLRLCKPFTADQCNGAFNATSVRSRSPRRASMKGEAGVARHDDGEWWGNPSQRRRCGAYAAKIARTEATSIPAKAVRQGMWRVAVSVCVVAARCHLLPWMRRLPESVERTLCGTGRGLLGGLASVARA